MRVMTAHTTIFTRADAVVTSGKGRSVDLMAIGTDRNISPLSNTELRRMDVVTRSTIPGNCRRMANTAVPVLIDLMATKTKVRL